MMHIDKGVVMFLLCGFFLLDLNNLRTCLISHSVVWFLGENGLLSQIFFITHLYFACIYIHFLIFVKCMLVIYYNSALFDFSYFMQTKTCSIIKKVFDTRSMLIIKYGMHFVICTLNFMKQTLIAIICGTYGCKIQNCLSITSEAKS